MAFKGETEPPQSLVISGHKTLKVKPNLTMSLLKIVWFNEEQIVTMKLKGFFLPYLNGHPSWFKKGGRSSEMSEITDQLLFFKTCYILHVTRTYAY